MTTMKQWRGLKTLVHDAVEHGSRAVERVHIETAKRPFSVLEAFPGIGVVARGVHVIHDACVSSTYEMVRLVNRVVADVGDVALESIEKPAKDSE